jgi:hypothetical protein
MWLGGRKRNRDFSCQQQQFLDHLHGGWAARRPLPPRRLRRRVPWLQRTAEGGGKSGFFLFLASIGNYKRQATAVVNWWVVTVWASARLSEPPASTPLPTKITAFMFFFLQSVLFMLWLPT